VAAFTLGGMTLEAQNDYQFSQARGTEELRKRGTSRLWYRQDESEPMDPEIPAMYVARSTSLLSPDVVNRHEAQEALIQQFR
jgi:hypothetical protein